MDETQQTLAVMGYDSEAEPEPTPETEEGECHTQPLEEGEVMSQKSTGKKGRKRKGENGAEGATPSRRYRSLTGPRPSQDIFTSSQGETSDTQKIIAMLKGLTSHITKVKTTLTREIHDVKEQVEVIKEEVKTLKLTPPPPMLTPNQIDDEIAATTLVTKLEKIQESLEKLEQKAAPQLNQTRNQILTVKNTITTVKDVTDKLNKRKVAYYQHHQNNDRVTIHTQWMESTPPIIPANFLPKYIINEPAREYQIRQSQKKKDLESWLQILSCRAEAAKEEVNNIDGAVLQEIQDSDLGEEEKEKQNEAWMKAAREEEKKSEEIWNKKRVEILKLPDIQKKNERIQIRDGRTYATVAKTSSEETMENQGSFEERWQEVPYRNQRRNNNQPRQADNRRNITSDRLSYTNSANNRSANNRRPSDFIRRGPPQRMKSRNQYDRR